MNAMHWVEGGGGGEYSFWRKDAQKWAVIMRTHARVFASPVIHQGGGKGIGFVVG